MQKSNRVYHFTSSGKSSDILELSSSESPPGYRPSQGLSFFPSVPLDKLWVESPTWKSSHKTHLSHPSKLVILYRPVSIQEQGTHLTIDEHHYNDDDDDAVSSIHLNLHAVYSESLTVSWRNYKLSILYSKTLLFYYSSWWRQLNHDCTEFVCDRYRLSCTYREA